jgi:hypothetical protein
MDLVTIDLNRAEQSVSSLSNDERKEYQPKTLQQHNSARSVYLPLFPTKSFGPNDRLLLANVPGSYFHIDLLQIFSFYYYLVTRLTPGEIARRQHGAYISDALTMRTNDSTYCNDGFSLSQEDAEELAARLHVDMSIITFNADRLRGICYYLLALHESFRRNVLHQKDVACREPIPNLTQMAIALEFYLQIDGESIYHLYIYIC